MTDPPVSVRVHLEALITANDQKYQAQFNAQQTAVSTALASAAAAVAKAETAADKRFESVNEFRALVSDQQRTLMPRVESEVRLHSLSDKLSVLEAKVESILAEKRGVSGGWGFAVGIAGFIAVVLSLVNALVSR